MGRNNLVKLHKNWTIAVEVAFHEGKEKNVILFVDRLLERERDRKAYVKKITLRYAL